MNASDHQVSTFDLDVHWASGQPADAKLAKHLDGCARCREYLEHLRVLNALPVPAPEPRAPTHLLRAPPTRWLLAAAAVLVVAGTGAAVWRRAALPSAESEGDHPAYVATKSAPAAQVLVRRSGRTTVWDERAPVRPGDALALRVACEEMPRVSVLVPSGPSWTRVSEGPCRGEEPLPFTLVVDDHPGEERVAVVFSRIPLDEAVAFRAGDDRTRSRDVWTLVLVFAKEAGAP